MHGHAHVLKPACLSATDPYFGNVLLLLGVSGGAFVDQGPHAHALNAVGTPTVDAVNTLFGRPSLLLNNAAEGLSAADSVDWWAGPNPYTVELWVRHNSGGAGLTSAYVGQWGDTAGVDTAWFFFLDAGVLKMRQSDTTGDDVGAAWAPTAGQWHHLVACRNAAGKTRIRADGVMIASSAALATLANRSAPLTVGYVHEFPGIYHAGNLAELRISNICRPEYDTDATVAVPVAAFPRSL